MIEMNDGGTAFPFSAMPAGWSHLATTGMSLRDWFAGQALQGMHASRGTASMYDPEAIKIMARVAYEQADAMLKVRAARAGEVA